MTTANEMTQAMNQTFSIERPVGERETNHSDDLEAVRNALAEHGLCQRTVTGQRNAKFKPDLTAGIRIFQRKAGLHPDGLVVPGGPTAMALALSGEVTSTHAAAESKKVDCAALRKLVEVAAEQLDSMVEGIEAKDKVRLRLKGELSQIISTLVQMAGRLKLGIVPNTRNLNAVSRILNNLENIREVQQAQGKVRDARGKISKIQDLENELAFLLDQRKRAEQRLQARTARYDRFCSV